MNTIILFNLLNLKRVQAAINRATGVTAGQTRRARSSNIRRGVSNRARRRSGGGNGG